MELVRQENVSQVFPPVRKVYMISYCNTGWGK